MIVRELITLLGFKADDKAFSKYNAQFASLAGAAGVVAGAVAVAGAAMLVMAKSTADAGDEALHSAKKYNTTVESLMALRYAAKIFNVDAGTLNTSLKFLSKNIEAVRSKNKGQIESFKKLNPAVLAVLKSGKNADGVFSDLADVFEKMPDGPRKTALALELFGRAGDDLIPMLSQGKASLQKFKEEAIALGAVMSTDAAKRADEFNDSLDRLGFIAKGLTYLIGDGMIKALQPVINDMVEWYKANRQLISQNIGEFFEYLIATVRYLWPVIKAAGEGFNAFFAPFGGFIGFLKSFAAGCVLIIQLLTELIALPGLLLQDWKVFLDGGDSLIGLFFKSIKGYFMSFGQWLIGWMDWILNTFNPFEMILSMLDKLPGIASKAGSFLSEGLGLSSSPSSSPTSSTSNVQNASSVRVNAPINVSVPEGTPAGEVGDKVYKGVKDGLSQVLRPANKILATGVAY